MIVNSYQLNTFLTSCQDMIFLNLYFDQFYARLMNSCPSLHRCSSYDLDDFVIYEQNGFIVWDAN